MTRIVAVEYVTLDGVMEEPAWSAPYFDDEVARFQYDNLFGADALLLGRRTYEGFAAAWPAMTGDPQGFGERMNALPKLVATRTLTEPAWNATFLPGDAVQAVADLKRTDATGTLLVNGSGNLLTQLLADGLVDELRLMVYPVVVASGRKLFPEGGAALGFALTSVRRSPSGVVISAYEPA